MEPQNDYYVAIVPVSDGSEAHLMPLPWRQLLDQIRNVRRQGLRVIRVQRYYGWDSIDWAYLHRNKGDVCPDKPMTPMLTRCGGEWPFGRMR